MKALVTGGTGFVGSALIKSLLADGHEVVSIARSKKESFSKLAAVTQVSFDFAAAFDGSQIEILQSALSGCEVVFHVASKVAMWGARESFYQVNVTGTEILLEAAKQAGVKRFIYTSSPSVIANGTDLAGVDESMPYPAHYEAFYPETKAIAERLVLAAHSEAFRTLALRPHLIFGPGDTNLIPTILAKARAGRLAIIGAGKNRVDFSYIEDCVAAHRCAEQALARHSNATASNGANNCGGRPYFISQGEPMNLWEFINQILKNSGQPALTRRISRPLATAIATALECGARIFGGEPALSRFLVSEMATEHFFNLNNARTLLNYAPRFSMQEAIGRTLPFGAAET